MKLRVNPFLPRRQSPKLSDALKFRREMACLSQAEAAEILHVSTRTYWNWEAGRGTPWPRHRRRIAAWIEEVSA
jgi:transcriptional regulator with XRE-family HTH domain